MNYIIFDVDGVLNGTDANANWIDEDIDMNKLKNLILLAKATDAKLVMSSTLRTAWNEKGKLIRKNSNTVLLHNALKKVGCPLYSVTPIINYERGEEIKQWLSEHAEEDHFICLDDEKIYYENDSFFDGKFIQTAPAHCNGAYGKDDVVGLFASHVAKGIELIKNQ